MLMQISGISEAHEGEIMKESKGLRVLRHEHATTLEHPLFSVRLFDLMTE